MRAPTVSVVIPTYDRLHCLGRAIDGALAQEGVETEVIVVDDASPDRADLWVKGRYRDVAVLRLAANSKVAAARNAGLALSRGRFIAFLDDDDRWEPAFLRRHLAALDARPDAVLSYCDFTSVGEDGGSPVPRASGDFGEDPVRTLLLENPIRSLSLTLIRRDALERAGAFQEHYRMCEDRDLYLRLSAEGAFVHERRALAFKTRSADSMTTDFTTWSDWAQNLLDDFFEREQAAPYRGLERPARARWDARIAIKCLRTPGQRLLGLSLAASAMRWDAAGTVRYLVERASERS